MFYCFLVCGLICVQEMVGAAGPLRNGDEVEFLLPLPPSGRGQSHAQGQAHLLHEGSAGPARRAVGAVRVQVS